MHNHPSGDPTPSEHDIDATRKVKEVGDIMGIALMDHIIIGVDDYKSFKESGLI